MTDETVTVNGQRFRIEVAADAEVTEGECLCGVQDCEAVHVQPRED